MGVEVRKWAARVRAFALSILVCVAPVTWAQDVTAGAVNKGVSWLTAQVGLDGTVTGEANSLATVYQNRAEVLQTLILLSNLPPALGNVVGANVDQSTEYVSRQIIGLAAIGQDTSTAMAQLASRANADGGFGGAPGYASTALDTAFALLAIKASNSPTVPQAPLNYLIAQQQPDGSFQINHRANLYASAYALNALKAYATQPGVSNALTNASNYIVAQQTAPGNWGNSISLSALVYLSIDDIVASNNIGTSIASNLMGAQAADGSWNDDPYVTSLALRALHAAGGVLNNPLLASVQGKVFDGYQGLPLQGVNVVFSGPATATLTTAADGSFKQINLPAGSYTIAINQSGFGTFSNYFTLGKGQALNVGTLMLQPTAPSNINVVRGTVSDHSTGRPLAGATVTVGSQTVTSSRTGEYQVSNIPPGRVTVSAAMTGYQTTSLSIIVDAGATVVFSPQLDTSGGVGGLSTVTGTVVDATNNKPLAGVTVTYSDRTGQKITTSDSAGKFKAANLLFNGSTGGAHFQFDLGAYKSQAMDVVLNGIPAIDIGQVRLQSQAVSSLVPDVAVLGVDRTATISDAQKLTVSGYVTVTLQNRGTADVPAGIKLLAFEDSNQTNAYEPGVDVVLGQATLANPIVAGDVQTVQIPVSGKTQFRDMPIWVLADSDNTLLEVTKANNLGSTMQTVARQPSALPFSPVVKWNWNAANVIATPVVGPLTDTNHDGKFDDQDVPTVIVVAAFGIDGGAGAITALSGKDGSLLWQVTDPSLYTASETHPAIADLNHDGNPAIIYYLKSTGGVAVLNHDGSLRCKSAPFPHFLTPYTYFPVTIADLDGDGKSEIIVGNYVYNSDCSSKFSMGTQAPALEVLGGPIVADLDLDGKPEIISADGVYRNDGTLWWPFPINGGGQPAGHHAAVARLDPNDTHPQIITSFRQLIVYRYDGSVMWGPIDLGYNSGPPLIVDVDGSGTPGIGVVTPGSYRFYNANGSLRWSAPIQDASSITGASAFDFDGSGHPKIVYFDETTLWVFDGKTGQVVFSRPNTSATATEYPIVVDVDGDGHADILAVQNGSQSGVTAYQDANNAWIPTRKIWNQYAYHITNVNADGSIPAHEVNSWDSTNTYRFNALPGVDVKSLPDLTASYVRINDQGGQGPSTVTVRIGNAGAQPVAPGVKVALYSGTPGAAGSTLLATSSTSTAIAGDSYQDITLTLNSSLANIATITVVSDDDGAGNHALQDYDRSNNAVTVPVTAQPTSLAVVIAADQTRYTANSNVVLTATLSNSGTLDQTANVRMLVIAPDQSTAAMLPTQSAGVTHGAHNTVQSIWNSGNAVAGNYQAVAQILDANGQIVSSAATTFSLVAAPGATASVALTTDKQTYGANDNVVISDKLGNLSANTALNNVMLTTTVTGPDGGVRMTQTENLAQLAANGSKDYRYGLSLQAATAGQYTVTANANNKDGSLLAQATTRFTVSSSAQTGNGLSGSIAVSPKQVQAGSALTMSYTVKNSGNSAFNALPITVNIIDPAAPQQLGSVASTLNVGVGNSSNGNSSWTANGSNGKTYIAVLTVSVGGSSITLAQDTFTVLAPTVSLVVKQAFVNDARVLVLAHCSDDDDDGAEKRQIKSDDTHHGTCSGKSYRAIDAMLTSAHLSHTIATTADDFKTAMRSGLYNTYWLANTEHSLGDDVSAELAEMVYAGSLLMIDGNGDGNHTLDPVSGVKSRISVKSNATLTLTGNLYPGGGKLSAVGAAIALKPASDATVQASFDASAACSNSSSSSGSSYGTSSKDTDCDHKSTPATSPGAAIVTRKYGSGLVWTAGVDLGRTLQSQSATWTPVLTQTISETLAQPIAGIKPLPAGATIGVQTLINNMATSSVGIDLTNTLPSGSHYLGSTPTAAYAPATMTAEWQDTLGAFQDASAYIMHFQVPSKTGQYQLGWALSSVVNGSKSPVGSPTSFIFNVNAATDGANSVLAALKGLSLTSDKEKTLRDTLVKNLGDAMKSYSKNNVDGYSACIDELVEIVDRLPGITTRDTSSIHMALDFMLQDAQWHWAQLKASAPSH